MSPTTRTLKLLRDDGWTADVCERFIAPAGVRRDLFNYADVEAFDDKLTIHVQCCASSGFAARVEKIIGNPHARRWVKSPHRELWVVGWRKHKRAVERKYWRPKIRKMVDSDFEAVE